jgi:hypothetical protein
MILLYMARTSVARLLICSFHYTEDFVLSGCFFQVVSVYRHYFVNTDSFHKKRPNGVTDGERMVYLLSGRKHGISANYIYVLIITPRYKSIL